MSESEPIGTHIPIILPGELNRRLEDKLFSNNIAGVTTTSIDAVRRLLSDPTRNFEKYEIGYINIDLVDDVYEELIGRSISDKISPANTISRNIEAYGHTQAATGLLFERGASNETIKELTYTHDFGWFTHKTLSDLTDSEIDDKFSNYKKISTYIQEIWPRDLDYTQSVEKALKEIFPTSKKVTNYLKELRDRNGVQLLLGDQNKLINYARNQNHEPVDDAGITLYEDIPRSLILGIVPRGKFEQQELSSL